MTLFIIYSFIIFLCSYYIGLKYIKFNFYNIFLLLIFYIYNIYLFLNTSYIVISIINTLILCFLYLVVIVDRIEFWIPNLSVYGVLFLNIIKYIIFKNYDIKITLESTMFIFLIIIFIVIIELILKKEIIGFGDLKLLFVLSIGYKFINYLFLIMIASIIGIIFYLFKKNKQEPLAFGPCIVFSFMIILLFK